MELFASNSERKALKSLTAESSGRNEGREEKRRRDEAKRGEIN